jgi:exosortase/archaeosortase family protein
MNALVNVIPLSPGIARRLVAETRYRLARSARLVAPAAERLRLAPPWIWPLIAVAASWPSLWWSLWRFQDRSDDPLGIVAWCALLFALHGSRARFAHPPRIGRLAAAALVSLAASAGSTIAAASMPDLARAGLATIAFLLALAAIVDDDEPLVPYTGFAILTLPLLSSLQFYAGFPLRVVTAEASRWLLAAAGESVARDGSALTVDGHLVLVDAPCSGIQMAWVCYFTACFSAWLFRTANGAALKRMSLVGMLILGGNVVRNTILVGLEAHGGVDEAAHAAIGLAVVALVAAAIVVLFATCRVRVRALRRIRVESRERFFAPPADRVDARPLLVATAFALAASLPLASRPAPSAPSHTTTEWPTRLDDQPLVPVALSDVERRFAADFPGSLARFSNGARTVVLRDVEHPTRRLHPAADCYRALGYAIARERLERDGDGRLARCFEARRRGGGLRVCERIVDAAGRVDTDVSSWYWNAILGRSQGPWRASTVAEPIGSAA